MIDMLGENYLKSVASLEVVKTCNIYDFKSDSSSVRWFGKIPKAFRIIKV